MKLKIDKLQVSELVDTGSFIDTQDPCLKIKIGKSEFITERLSKMTVYSLRE